MKDDIDEGKEKEERGKEEEEEEGAGRLYRLKSLGAGKRF